MKTAVLVVCLLLAAVVAAQADSQIAAAQQALKDGGFYYGEVTGTKDADTTAAIRRYQIRNGLQVTGELNAETRKSLKLAGGAPAPSTAPSAPPVRRATPTPPPDTSDLRAEQPHEGDLEADELEPETNEPAERFPSEPVPRPGYAPGPRGLYPDTRGVFQGTPYEVAPPDLQRQVIVGAQMRLARQGYYRAPVDGLYGPAMEAALSSYQLRLGLEPTGTLDMETLGELGLLPGGNRRRIGPPRRRMIRPPAIIAPNGERVYVPR